MTVDLGEYSSEIATALLAVGVSLLLLGFERALNHRSQKVERMRHALDQGYEKTRVAVFYLTTLEQQIERNKYGLSIIGRGLVSEKSADKNPEVNYVARQTIYTPPSEDSIRIMQYSNAIYQQWSVLIILIENVNAQAELLNDRYDEIVALYDSMGDQQRSEKLAVMKAGVLAESAARHIEMTNNIVEQAQKLDVLTIAITEHIDRKWRGHRFYWCPKTIQQEIINYCPDNETMKRETRKYEQHLKEIAAQDNNRADDEDNILGKEQSQKEG